MNQLLFELYLLTVQDLNPNYRTSNFYVINLEQIEMLRIAVFNIVDSEIYDPNELLKEGKS